MSDLISRQAAIDAIEEMQIPIMRSKFSEEQFVFTGMSEALRAIKDLPSAQPEPSQIVRDIATIIENEQDMRVMVQPEPQWIPVSEKSPEEKEKHYWVCTDTGYQCQCRWTNINHFWTDLTTEWHWHIMDTPQYSKVIAWMPLPEPYRGERRTDEAD